jgi:hypothetical protein
LPMKLKTSAKAVYTIRQIGLLWAHGSASDTRCSWLRHLGPALPFLPIKNDDMIVLGYAIHRYNTRIVTRKNVKGGMVVECKVSKELQS